MGVVEKKVSTAKVSEHATAKTYLKSSKNQIKTSMQPIRVVSGSVCQRGIEQPHWNLGMHMQHTCFCTVYAVTSRTNERSWNILAQIRGNCTCVWTTVLLLHTYGFLLLWKCPSISWLAFVMSQSSDYGILCRQVSPLTEMKWRMRRLQLWLPLFSLLTLSHSKGRRWLTVVFVWFCFAGGNPTQGLLDELYLLPIIDYFKICSKHPIMCPVSYVLFKN